MSAYSSKCNKLFVISHSITVLSVQPFVCHHSLVNAHKRVVPELQNYIVSTLWWCIVSTLQCLCVIALQGCSVSASFQHCTLSAFQRCSVVVFRYCSVLLQCFSVAVFRVTVFQSCSVSALQYFSIAVFQDCNVSAFRCCGNCRTVAVTGFRRCSS